MNNSLNLYLFLKQNIICLQQNTNMMSRLEPERLNYKKQHHEGEQTTEFEV